MLKFQSTIRSLACALIISVALAVVAACSNGDETSSQMSMVSPPMQPKTFANSNGDYEIAIEPARGAYAIAPEPEIQLAMEEPPLNDRSLD